jgi:hypothetical protein
MSKRHLFSRFSLLIERDRQFERAIGLPHHQPMPGSAMDRAFFVYEYQRVGIEGAVIVAFTADMNQPATVLAF